ncbi:diguanylate cyclase (GGDEF)-like protein [Pelomonas saccharophila]|uniref:diguanylate cyclase n=1 Tax=Roseateles saccharophilus TaxID=304 RepID=A0ABU1YJ81_ROSSA|nr:GGDEF domain-containing protein [Roseateles saccharophilus]MDR7268907.1 diguanylate cyclase (GGDEF)-like protein [Roseateles saccharophilus]
MSQVVDHLAELTGFRDRDVMDVTLVMALRDLLEPESAAIYRLVGEPGHERWLTRAHLRAGDAVASADPLWAKPEALPLATDHPLRLEAMRSRSVTQVADGGKWLYLFPIATDRDVIGVIEILSTRRLGAGAQRMVSSVLRIYHNFQGLLDYSERDTLTGLLNRKTFDESFLKVLSEIPAKSPPPEHGTEDRRHEAAVPHYVLGVIDIDHFKSVNDRFGHLIGDEVLLLLSRLMRGSFRFHDLLYRFGGEEFVVLMRCDEEIHAGEAFERLRVNTERYAFPQVGRITVSIGFTEVRAGDAPAAAFERADKAVYHAKGHGRNQVHNYAALVASGVIQEATQLSDVELF